MSVQPFAWSKIGWKRRAAWIAGSEAFLLPPLLNTQIIHNIRLKSISKLMAHPKGRYHG